MSYRADKLGDGRTDGLTDGLTQATTIPGGQNWPRVKMTTYQDFTSLLKSPIVAVQCYGVLKLPVLFWFQSEISRGSNSVFVSSDILTCNNKFDTEIEFVLVLCWSSAAASIMRPLSRGRPRDNSAVHGASEDVPGMTYDVPGVSYPIPWTSGDCPQGVRPADGPGTHSLASTGPFSQAAVHRASGLLRFSQSQRGRIMDRKWGCPQYVRNRKLMSRSCPGNATATLLAALTFFVKNKLILL